MVKGRLRKIKVKEFLILQSKKNVLHVCYNIPNAKRRTIIIFEASLIISQTEQIGKNKDVNGTTNIRSIGY